MTEYRLDIERIYCIGDLHGNFDLLYNWLKRTDFENTLIIICGDIGLGFAKEAYYHQVFGGINTYCNERNIHLYAFRGNHDDPSYFNGEKINYSNIKAIPDYSVIVANNGDAIHKILCIGGGTSIDRIPRISRDRLKATYVAIHKGYTLDEAREVITLTYWDNEAPSYDPIALGELHDIEVVCTHTSPSFVGFKDKKGIERYLNDDIDLEKDLDKERETMDMVYNDLIKNENPIKQWIYAHFHTHMSEEYNGIQFTMLDMCREYNQKFDSLEIR